MTKDDFISNYMNKQLKKNKLPYGLQYLNWLASKEEKAEKLYKFYKKNPIKTNNMTDFSKIETKQSPINTMTDAELNEHFDNYQEQLANALLIIDYLDKTQFTKVWHERADYLMKNFTITNKNK